MIYSNETGDGSPQGKIPEDVWKVEPAKLIPEPVIDDYEVKIVFDDGTKTALYFKQVDFIKDLSMVNVDRIVIKPRWKNV